MSVIHIAVLGVLFLIILLLRDEAWQEFPMVLKLFFFSMVVAFLMSWLVILATGLYYVLYLPSRYTEAGLILFLLIFVIVNARKAAGRLALLISNHRLFMIGIVGAVSIVVLAVIFYLESFVRVEETIDPTDLRSVLGLLVVVLIGFSFLLLFRRDHQNDKGNKLPKSVNSLLKFIILIFVMILSAVYVYTFRPLFQQPSETDLAIIDFMRSTQKDSRFAGMIPTDPYMARMFGKRQILVQCPETDIDFNLHNTNASFVRLNEIDVLMDFCHVCDVDYFGVDEQSFTKESLAAAKSKTVGTKLANVFNQLDPEMMFALASVPTESRQFQIDEYFFVACDETLIATLSPIGSVD